MEKQLELDIQSQPDDTTCGPTCLHAVYRYFGDDVDLNRLIAEVPALDTGGTLAVLLACHALRRGYQATIFTYNLQMFDPTWLSGEPVDLVGKLKAQRKYKRGHRLQAATEGYLEYLQSGGRVLLEDLTASLLRRYLDRSIPVLTGLSATYLYRSPREYGPNDEDDDIRGEPSGHFVVLCGYDKRTREITVADPQHTNPLGKGRIYRIQIDRVLNAILLGILTYDGNLLILEPSEHLRGRLPCPS